MTDTYPILTKGKKPNSNWKAALFIVVTIVICYFIYQSF